MKQIMQHPWTTWIFKKRFMKFGTVGASGVLVNLAVLYLCQEYLFTAIPSLDIRLNVSLAAAILCATVNNFFWNRAWTWSDRFLHPDKQLLLGGHRFAGVADQAVRSLFVLPHCQRERHCVGERVQFSGE
jgi:putative flippase GtrA